jgi:hypothetical protein
MNVVRKLQRKTWRKTWHQVQVWLGSFSSDILFHERVSFLQTKQLFVNTAVRITLKTNSGTVYDFLKHMILFHTCTCNLCLPQPHLPFFLVQLIELKTQVSLNSDCLSSVNFSHFHFFLHNHCVSFIWTWYKISLGKGN